MVQGQGKGGMVQLLKNIPNGPVQDFIMQAYVTCKSKRINEMGRVEIAILDENSKVLSKIAMTDVFWQAEQNFGTMVMVMTINQEEEV